MSFDASNETGGASVETGAQAPLGNTGTLTQITSLDGSVAITNPLGPIVDLSVPLLAGGVIATVDSVNTTGVKLSGLASAALNQGALAFVVTVGDYFRLEQGALTVDNITVVNASGKAGYQWVRRLMPKGANAIVATWSVDTTSGNDENAGTTDLTAVKTLQEIKRRLWGLTITQTVTVRILTDTANTDTGTWNTQFVGVGFLLIQGILGASTGPGPTAHDNTIHSGTLTSAPTVPANVPSADDYEIVDTGIPVSWTASGMLAVGVIFKRTNSTNLNWYALKDLGSKTLRITNPMNNVGAATWTALNNADAYTAYQMVKVYAQDFGNWALFVRFDSVDDEGSAAQTPGYGCQYRRAYRSGASKVIVAGLHVNCLINLVSGSGEIYSRGELETVPQFNGGGFKSTGALAINFETGHYGITGIYVCQGVSLLALDGAYLTLESESATHDFTGGANTGNYVAKGASQILFQVNQAGQGISGKGNTGKLVLVTQQGEFGYALGGGTPPLSSASSSDASPIQIGPNNFSVASMPAALETVLTPSTFKNTLP